MHLFQDFKYTLRDRGVAFFTSVHGYMRICTKDDNNDKVDGGVLMRKGYENIVHSRSMIGQHEQCKQGSITIVRMILMFMIIIVMFVMITFIIIKIIRFMMMSIFIITYIILIIITLMLMSIIIIVMIIMMFIIFIIMIIMFIIIVIISMMFIIIMIIIMMKMNGKQVKGKKG